MSRSSCTGEPPRTLFALDVEAALTLPCIELAVLLCVHYGRDFGWSARNVLLAAAVVSALVVASAVRSMFRRKKWYDNPPTTEPADDCRKSY